MAMAIAILLAFMSAVFSSASERLKWQGKEGSGVVLLLAFTLGVAAVCCARYL